MEEGILLSILVGNHVRFPLMHMGLRLRLDLYNVLLIGLVTMKRRLNVLLRVFSLLYWWSIKLACEALVQRNCVYVSEGSCAVFANKFRCVSPRCVNNTLACLSASKDYECTFARKHRYRSKGDEHRRA